jgi:hypothetical protein
MIPLAVPPAKMGHKTCHISEIADLIAIAAAYRRAALKRGTAVAHGQRRGSDCGRAYGWCIESFASRARHLFEAATNKPKSAEQLAARFLFC